MAITAYALTLQEQICHLANLPLIVQLKGVEKSPSTRSKQMGTMKIPSKMKTSATVAIIELPTLPLKVFIALHLQIERNPIFKKFSLKNSDMQKVKIYVLRVMKEYCKNEKGKNMAKRKIQNLQNMQRERMNSHKTGEIFLTPINKRLIMITHLLLSLDF